MKIGFIGILTLIFVVAKLFGYVTWSWWVVFSPMWAIILFVFVLILIKAIAEAYVERNR